MKILRRSRSWACHVVLALLFLSPPDAKASLLDGMALANSVWDYWNIQTEYPLPIVRSLALANLSRFPENADRAAPLIRKRLTEETEAYMRIEIVQALGRCCVYGSEATRKQIADEMLVLLQSPSESERIKEIALAAVLRSHDPRAVPLLCGLLDSGNDSQKEFALIQLANFKDTTVESAVLNCLNRAHTAKNTNLVLACLTTLHKVGSASSVQVLLGLMRTDASIRYEVIAALDAIQPKIGTESLNAILAAEKAEQERLALERQAEQDRLAQAEAQRRANEAGERARIEQDKRDREALVAVWDRWEAEELRAALEASATCIQEARDHKPKSYLDFCRHFAEAMAKGREATLTNQSPDLKSSESIINPLLATLELGFRKEGENQAWYFEFKIRDDQKMWVIAVFKPTGSTGTSKAAEPWMVDACEEANLAAGREHKLYREPPNKPTKPRPAGT